MMLLTFPTISKLERGRSPMGASYPTNGATRSRKRYAERSEQAMTMCSQHPSARPILHILGLGVAGIHWHETKHKPAKREVTRMCILIVDDHLSLLTLLTIFLEDIGYEVVTVRNGHEALAWLRHI